ncbi:MAG: class I SAM-dependent methyltransferase family protein, partial [Methanobrevibacter sp.]|nr:class I SAM-dependent methyltransferase family protein [Candidatus Methanoflexus mossambicus]
MLAIKVPLKETNEIRKILMEKGFMDMNYKIQTDNSYGYLPLKLEIRNNEVLLKELENNEISFEIIEKNLEKIEKHAKSLSETLKGKLTNEEIENLKTSFDIIGDIVILEIPEDLQKYKDIIGKAALEFT